MLKTHFNTRNALHIGTILLYLFASIFYGLIAWICLLGYIFVWICKRKIWRSKNLKNGIEEEDSSYIF